MTHATRLTRRQSFGLIAGAGVLLGASSAQAEDAAVIDTRVDLALKELYQTVPGSRDLADRALGVLVMPSVVKGGFIVGGSYGEGALRLPQGGALRTNGYYSVAAASIGLQAGVQESAHALFFLTEGALSRFQRADGWEFGADAEVTLLDKGVNLGVDSTIYQKPVVAIVFGQDGLLLGASLEGAKYSPIQR
ncbi:MAG: YSC84-related protein [Pseudomonadota bacterium]